MAVEAFLSFTSSSGTQIGDPLKVMECEFGFIQNTDITGKPSSKPKGGTLTLIVESTDNSELADWMISHNAKKNGVITFTLRNNKKKEISFTNGICIQYHEYFNYKGEELPMYIRITISADKLKILDVEYTNDWKD